MQPVRQHLKNLIFFRGDSYRIPISHLNLQSALYVLLRDSFPIVLFFEMSDHCSVLWSLHLVVLRLYDVEHF